LLGKVIAWAPSRTAAAGKLATALDQIFCAGVRTNERWLARILRAPEFLEARHSIAFLETHARQFADGAQSEPLAERRAAAFAALALQAGPTTGVAQPLAAANPWAASDGFTPNLPGIVQFSVLLRGQERAVAIQSGPRDAMTISVDGNPVSVSHVVRTGGALAATVDGLRVNARAFVYEIHVHVWLDGQHYDFLYEDPRSKEFSASASRGSLTTPLPGVVAAVVVSAGQVVAAGDVLMVIEAMKMEHTISAPFAGTVETLHFARGDRVPEGSALLELTPASAD
jgi:3-methylcrotonyl-CoA carboxylase alpha subunit